MRLVQVLLGVMLMTSCTQALPKSANEKERDAIASEDIPKNHRKQLEDEVDINDAFDAEQGEDEQLPVLPPIILLDFVNGTDDKTGSSDEKSKRTIDGRLGYGLYGNNLFSGEHNYYIPGGKSGTTSVTIEESISPFEPKTVTEIEKPITEKSQEGPDDQKTKKPPLFEQLPDPLPLQNQREALPIYPPYSTYGQRTKLHKTSSPDFSHQNHHHQLNKPFSYGGSDAYNRLLTSYTAAKPAGHQTGLSAYVNNYARPMTAQYLNNYQKHLHDSRPSQSQTVTAADGQNINLASYPRYTVENGVRYEHKIVWKYPDGKVLDTPPVSYDAAQQTEYPDQQKFSQVATTGGFRPSSPYHPRPTATKTGYNSDSTAHSNIHSQKPIQFPKDQEQPSDQFEQNDPSKFVSSSSLAGGSHYDATNAYNLDAQYQKQFGLRQGVKPSDYRHSMLHTPVYDSYGNRLPAPQYADVNNAGAAYGYYGGQGIFNANGQINKSVLSKYTPEVQNYLKRVFTNGKQAMKNEYQSAVPNSYANTDYSSLLNYNPSISQYIKNPSSILKAQPTFIQAGNSLIPVIILRVDGAPPVQSKKKSNINLKALLQQYLSEYANNVSKLAQSTNYDFGANDDLTSQTNPVEDLKHLTETLTSLRQRGHQDPDFTNSYQRQSKEFEQDYVSSYGELAKEPQKTTASHQLLNFPSSTTKRPTKVKSVTIIEDPKYTSYKYESH